MKKEELKKQINKIKPVFEKYGILAVYLFGSRGRGESDMSSDYDIGVVFVDPKKYRDSTLEVYSDLYKELVEVLPEDYLKSRFRARKHEFDLVFLQFSYISFQYKAIKEGDVIYESDRKQRLDYEEYLMKRYCDLAPLREKYKKAVLDRID